MIIWMRSFILFTLKLELNYKVMKLTGKCREEFELYFIEWYHTDFYLINQEPKGINFECLTKEMKYGVLVDYFDSVDVVIIVYNEYNSVFWDVDINGEWIHITLKGRPEARTKAIEKANEIRNEQLNK